MKIKQSFFCFYPSTLIGIKNYIQDGFQSPFSLRSFYSFTGHLHVEGPEGCAPLPTNFDRCISSLLGL